MELQIVSDLHLEFRPDVIDFIERKAPILCLLGDICVCGTTKEFAVFMEFIKIMCSKFDQVIHVPGNHEYYIQGCAADKNITNTVPAIMARLKTISKKIKNYRVMTNGMMTLSIKKKKLCIIGSTLWTHIPPEKEKEVQGMMNDYTYIHMPDQAQADQPTSTMKIRRFRAADMAPMHKASVSFIKRCITIATKNKIKCVLLTHHKPFWDEADNGNDHAHCYASKLGIVRPPLCLVAYGHTHKKDRRIVNGVPVVSNPRGYPGQKTGFDPSFVVTVKV